MDFYYTDLEEDESLESTSSPTLSHRDMARPPHEDPEYQRQIVGSMRQELLAKAPQQMNTVTVISTPTLQHHNYAWSQTSPVSRLFVRRINKLFD